MHTRVPVFCPFDVKMRTAQMALAEAVLPTIGFYDKKEQ
jgi:hypothetical protein